MMQSPPRADGMQPELSERIFPGSVQEEQSGHAQLGLDDPGNAGSSAPAFPLACCVLFPLCAASNGAAS